MLLNYLVLLSIIYSILQAVVVDATTASFVVKKRRSHHPIIKRQRSFQQQQLLHWQHTKTRSSLEFWLRDDNHDLFVDFGSPSGGGGSGSGSNKNSNKNNDSNKNLSSTTANQNSDEVIMKISSSSSSTAKDDKYDVEEGGGGSSDMDLATLGNSSGRDETSTTTPTTTPTNDVVVDDTSITAAVAAAENNNSNTRITTETTTATTTKPWKRRLSSISEFIILPGTPLFIRLLPFKPSEVISKIIDEMSYNTYPSLPSSSSSSSSLSSSRPLLSLPSSSSLHVNGGEEEEEVEKEEEDEVIASNANNAAAVSLALFASSPPSSLESLEKASRDDLLLNGESFHGEQRTETATERVVVAEKDAEPTSVVNDDKEAQQQCLVKENDDKEEEMSDKKSFGFFRRRRRNRHGDRGKHTKSHQKKRKRTKPQDNNHAISKEELQCPAIVSNIHEMREAILTNGTSLKDNKSEYQLGLELINQHNVLELIKERVRTNSTPGSRHHDNHNDDDESKIPHLALVIEGGGMRGAVSAGMAAALSTLDLLDVFDSIHGSSAGAIVGAYLVSRQLCTDIYTDIMPAAGSKFASTRRGMLNFGVDYLSDLIERKLMIPSSSSDEQVSTTSPIDDGEDVVCIQIEDDFGKYNFSDPEMWLCDDDTSSVELAMGRINVRQPKSVFNKKWSDDHYDGVMLESMNFLLSGVNSFAQKTISRPIAFGVRRFGRALRPALDALDFAAAMRQYLRRRPGMNLTYVLDGIMDDSHGLRPFDIDAFRANDKRQQLYVISSAVSNGGSGDMETIAFNAAEGDFFGLNDDSDENSKSANKARRVKWYRRVWSVVKSVPFAMYSAVRRTLFTSESDVVDETELPPPGTNAMYGFVNKNKKKKTKRSQERKSYSPTGRIDDEGKQGIYPCLEASALVPGAAGPPLQLIRSKNRKNIEAHGRFPRWRSKKELGKRKEQNSHICFDAFCYEPIPYRSAVEKANATHVLALRSRPDGCIVETKQHMYEKIVAPIYFRQNGMKQVARWFASGGSQYRYIEDILTLEEGLARGIPLGQDATTVKDYLHGVKIPPTKILYGADDAEPVAVDDWKRAHLLPITLPFGTPELPALSQDKDEVILAVRHGYASAFDVLAPIAGLPFDPTVITGEMVAELLFPMGPDDVDVLDKRVKIKSSYIGKNKDENEEEMKRRSFAAWITRKREAKRKVQEEMASHPDGLLARQAKRRYHESDQYLRDGSNTLEYIEMEALLAALPGFSGGRLDHISENLKKGKNNTSTEM
ncbi:hypothetical protein ACHAWC_007061 [Mediolabrus comicus]